MPPKTWTYEERLTLFLIKTRFDLSYHEAHDLFYRVHPNKLKFGGGQHSAQNLQDEFEQPHADGKAKMWNTIDRVDSSYSQAERAVFQLSIQTITAAASRTPTITLTPRNPPYVYVQSGTSSASRSKATGSGPRPATTTNPMLSVASSRSSRKRAQAEEEEELEEEESGSPPKRARLARRHRLQEAEQRPQLPEARMIVGQAAGHWRVEWADSVESGVSHEPSWVLAIHLDRADLVADWQRRLREERAQQLGNVPEVNVEGRDISQADDQMFLEPLGQDIVEQLNVDNRADDDDGRTNNIPQDFLDWAEADGRAEGEDQISQSEISALSQIARWTAE